MTITAYTYSMMYCTLVHVYTVRKFKTMKVPLVRYQCGQTHWRKQILQAEREKFDLGKPIEKFKKSNVMYGQN